METKPLIIAIDDKRFYLDEIDLEVRGKNVEYKPFLGPSVFEEEAKSEDVNRASLILVDYDFYGCTAVDLDLVGYIKDRFPEFKGKIVLISVLDDFFNDNDLVNKKFHSVINKKDLSWERIRRYLS